jgi:hypothetical protein
VKRRKPFEPRLTVEQFVERVQAVIQDEAKDKPGFDGITLAVMAKVLHRAMHDGEEVEQPKPAPVYGVQHPRRDPSKGSYFFATEDGRMHHTDENWDPRYGAMTEGKTDA